MTRSRMTVVVVAWSLCLCAAARAQEKPLAAHKREADAVLRLGAVSARADLDVVFDYARRVAEKGQTEEALKYYEAALRFNALSMDNQLAYAKLLAKAGKSEEASLRAKIVAGIAEDDALVAAARRLLGDEVSLELEPVAKPEGEDPVLVLVPMGEVDILLLREVRQRVAEALGIRVLLRKADIRMPPSRRRPFKDFVAGLRKGLDHVQTRFPEIYAAVLKEQGLADDDLKDDEKVIAVWRGLQARRGDDGARRYELAVRRARETPDQWNTTELIQALRKAVEPCERPKARFIGITRRDVFDKNYAYLLALRIDEHGVVSYHRYQADFTGEAPSRKRLRRRLYTQVINVAGHVYGLPRCSDPTCPRAYSHSVAEHDRKGEELCPNCKKAFEKAFGRKSAERD